MQLFAISADITTLPVDVIVNAANKSLAPGGGVCGAIHRAAGPELARACATVGPCPTGDARLTLGFKLPARAVVHAVGPVWKGGNYGEAAELSSAYRSALEFAADFGAVTIAFPAISTGTYGCPLSEACTIAVAAVQAFSGTPARPVRLLRCAYARGVRDVRSAGGGHASLTSASAPWAQGNTPTTQPGSPALSCHCTQSFARHHRRMRTPGCMSGTRQMGHASSSDGDRASAPCRARCCTSLGIAGEWTAGSA